MGHLVGWHLRAIAGILSAARQTPPKRAPTGGLRARQLKRVIDVLGAEVDRDISLSQLAREVRMSPFHFARAFKQSTGLPPHQYLVRLRIDRACELLETTHLSVYEIASAVGFNDPSYLARVFRRTIGLTPAEYRRSRDS
jgi:AraC family transcriptional regulator